MSEELEALLKTAVKLAVIANVERAAVARAFRGLRPSGKKYTRRLRRLTRTEVAGYYTLQAIQARRAYETAVLQDRIQRAQA